MNESSRRILTPHDLPTEFWRAMEAWGVPRNAEAVQIDLRAGEPIRIFVSFAVGGADGELRIVQDQIEKATHFFNLVPAGDPPPMDDREAAETLAALVAPAT